MINPMDLKREFNEYFGKKYPNVYKGDYSFHVDYESEKWNWFALKIQELRSKNPNAYNLKLKKILREQFKKAQWLGEDGEMVVNCKTKLGALKKFRELMREDVGEAEAQELTQEMINIQYLDLPTEEDREYFGDEFDWVVRASTVTPYPVFVLST